MNNDNLVKLMSIIYNPKKYPLNRKTFNTILEGLFLNTKERDKIGKIIESTDTNYYIANSETIFNPKKYAKILTDNLIKNKKTDMIWAFSVIYSKDYIDNHNFKYALAKILKDEKYKNKFNEFLSKEVNKLKNKEIFEKNYYDLDNIKGCFETYKNLDRIGFDLERITKSPILYLFELFTEINKKNWSEAVKKIENPLLKYILNQLYIRHTKDYKILSNIPPNSDDDIISLSILNILDFIDKSNKKQASKQIHHLLEKLSKLNYKRFYWYGIILSNAEYHIHNDENKLEFVENIVKTALKKDLINFKIPKRAIDNLKKGLKITPRDTSFRHLYIFKNISDKSISIKLMKEVIEDYKNIITKERCILYLIDHLGNENKNDTIYTDCIISALRELKIRENFDVIKYISDLLKNFHLTKEDYLYNFLKMIEEKSRVFHVFLVLFYVIQHLENTPHKIEKSTTNEYFEKFIDYINIHLKYENKELLLYLNIIFALNITIENNIIYKTIEILKNRPIPPFKSLAVLIKKVPENYKTIKIKRLIEEYFDKYHKNWYLCSKTLKENHFENWYEIFEILNDEKRKEICLDTFADWKKQEIQMMKKN